MANLKSNRVLKLTTDLTTFNRTADKTLVSVVFLFVILRASHGRGSKLNKDGVIISTILSHYNTKLKRNNHIKDNSDLPTAYYGILFCLLS
jgi:hypothetical protein